MLADDAVYVAGRGHQADATCALTRWQHFSAWNDSWPPSWKYDVILENWLLQSAKFHLDLIRNDGALGFCWTASPRLSHGDCA